jgi:hypothetical protein
MRNSKRRRSAFRINRIRSFGCSPGARFAILTNTKIFLESRQHLGRRLRKVGRDAGKVRARARPAAIKRFDVIDTALTLRGWFLFFGGCAPRADRRSGQIRKTISAQSYLILVSGFLGAADGFELSFAAAAHRLLLKGFEYRACATWRAYNFTIGAPRKGCAPFQSDARCPWRPQQE